MQLRLVKIALVQIATLLIFLAALFCGYVWFKTESAKSKAEAVCQSIPVGTSYESALATMVSIEVEPRLRTASPDFLSVGFRGAMMDRWLCNVQISDGRVASQEIRLLD